MALKDYLFYRSSDVSGVPGTTRIVPYYDPVAAAFTGEYRQEMLLFNNAGLATTVGDVYMAAYSPVAGKNPQVVNPAATTPLRELVVAVAIIADQALGWFATAGPVNCTLEGTGDIASNKYLKYVTATCLTDTATKSGFMLDGTSETADSFAIFCAPASGTSVTAAGNTRPTAAIPNKCILLGHRAAVA